MAPKKENTSTVLAVLIEQYKTITRSLEKVEDHISKKNDEFDNKIDAMNDKFEKRCDSLNDLVVSIKLILGDEPLRKQFASKMTEKLMYGLVGLILVAVVGQWVNIAVMKNSYEQTIASEVKSYLSQDVSDITYLK